jgi:hypothetical protein
VRKVKSVLLFFADAAGFRLRRRCAGAVTPAPFAVFGTGKRSKKQRKKRKQK